MPSRPIAHRLPYGRMAEAYEMIYRREKGMLGVIYQAGGGVGGVECALSASE